jgi:hypothetical protein
VAGDVVVPVVVLVVVLPSVVEPVAVGAAGGEKKTVALIVAPRVPVGGVLFGGRVGTWHPDPADPVRLTGQIDHPATNIARGSLSSAWKNDTRLA